MKIVETIIIIVALIIGSWLCAMLGYDKIKQTILQFKYPTGIPTEPTQKNVPDVPPDNVDTHINKTFPRIPTYAPRTYAKDQEE